MLLVNINFLIFIGSLCQDETNLNCQSWEPEYFFLQNGWYKECPRGYFGNTETWTCEVWDEAWTICSGKSRSQWNEWNKSLSYKLNGNTWNKVKWVDDQYLNSTDLECYNWDEGCLSWEFPNHTHCLKWNSLHLMLEEGTCTHWNEIEGFEINSFGVCQEIWGDKLNKGEYEWDDGNNEDGDGWSSTCLIEPGYKWDGSTWWEIVPPTAIISQINKDNIWTITFSEEVIVTDYERFEKSIHAEIIGPKSVYNFKYEIYKPSVELQGSLTIKNFKIRIFDVLSPLKGFGNEQVQFWFEDLSLIKDLADNNFAEGRLKGNLRYHEYVREGNF